MQAEATGIPLKAAKYDQVSTLVFNGRSPLINPGPQGAVQSLPTTPPPRNTHFINFTVRGACLAPTSGLVGRGFAGVKDILHELTTLS